MTQDLIVPKAFGYVFSVLWDLIFGPICGEAVPLQGLGVWGRKRSDFFLRTLLIPLKGKSSALNMYMPVPYRILLFALAYCSNSDR